MPIESMTGFTALMKTLSDDEVFERIAAVMRENDRKTEAVEAEAESNRYVELGFDLIADFLAE